MEESKPYSVASKKSNRRKFNVSLATFVVVGISGYSLSRSETSPLYLLPDLELPDLCLCWRRRTVAGEDEPSRRRS
ncbi:hypothetical protein Droror1_Dr00025551 [Drosera rotundifolia]